MKITKSKLRQLISEAVYKFGKAPRTIDYEMKQLDQGIDQSNTKIDSMLLQRQKDNLTVFDKEDPEYAEVFRQGLDPDRPEIDSVRQTFHPVAYYRPDQHWYGAPPDGVEVIKIPQELAKGVIDAHRAAKKAVFRVPVRGRSTAEIFRDAALRVFNYIEKEIKRIYGRDFYVYERGNKMHGYRDDEYAAAMEAAEEYLS